MTLLRRSLFALCLCAASSLPGQSRTPAPSIGPLREGQPVRGWTLLSSSEADDRVVIDAARPYRINHLELSHEIVMDLADVRNDTTRGLVNRLTEAAHTAGIQEVVVWDHALYELSHYPARFRTGPGGTLDLDDPAFWEWIKQAF